MELQINHQADLIRAAHLALHNPLALSLLPLSHPLLQPSRLRSILYLSQDLTLDWFLLQHLVEPSQIQEEQAKILFCLKECHQHHLGDENNRVGIEQIWSVRESDWTLRRGQLSVSLSRDQLSRTSQASFIENSKKLKNLNAQDWLYLITKFKIQKSDSCQVLLAHLGSNPAPSRDSPIPSYVACYQQRLPFLVQQVLAYFLESKLKNSIRLKRPQEELFGLTDEMISLLKKQSSQKKYQIERANAFPLLKILKKAILPARLLELDTPTPNGLLLAIHPELVPALDSLLLKDNGDSELLVKKLKTLLETDQKKVFYVDYESGQRIKASEQQVQLLIVNLIKVLRSHFSQNPFLRDLGFSDVTLRRFIDENLGEHLVAYLSKHDVVLSEVVYIVSHVCQNKITYCDNKSNLQLLKLVLRKCGQSLSQSLFQSLLRLFRSLGVKESQSKSVILKEGLQLVKEIMIKLKSKRLNQFVGCLVDCFRQLNLMLSLYKMMQQVLDRAVGQNLNTTNVLSILTLARADDQQFDFPSNEMHKTFLTHKNSANILRLVAKPQVFQDQIIHLQEIVPLIAAKVPPLLSDTFINQLFTFAIQQLKKLPLQLLTVSKVMPSLIVWNSFSALNTGDVQEMASLLVKGMRRESRGREISLKQSFKGLMYKPFMKTIVSESLQLLQAKQFKIYQQTLGLLNELVQNHKNFTLEEVEWLLLEVLTPSLQAFWDVHPSLSLNQTLEASPKYLADLFINILVTKWRPVSKQRNVQCPRVTFLTLELVANFLQRVSSCKNRDKHVYNLVSVVLNSRLSKKLFSGVFPNNQVDFNVLLQTLVQLGIQQELAKQTVQQMEVPDLNKALQMIEYKKLRRFIPPEVPRTQELQSSGDVSSVVKRIRQIILSFQLLELKQSCPQALAFLRDTFSMENSQTKEVNLVSLFQQIKQRTLELKTKEGLQLILYFIKPVTRKHLVVTPSFLSRLIQLVLQTPQLTPVFIEILNEIIPFIDPLSTNKTLPQFLRNNTLNSFLLPCLNLVLDKPGVIGEHEDGSKVLIKLLSIYPQRIGQLRVCLQKMKDSTENCKFQSFFYQRFLGVFLFPKEEELRVYNILHKLLLTYKEAIPKEAIIQAVYKSAGNRLVWQELAKHLTFNHRQFELKSKLQKPDPVVFGRVQWQVMQSLFVRLINSVIEKDQPGFKRAVKIVTNLTTKLKVLLPFLQKYNFQKLLSKYSDQNQAIRYFKLTQVKSFIQFLFASTAFFPFSAKPLIFSLFLSKEIDLQTSLAYNDFFISDAVSRTIKILEFSGSSWQPIMSKQMLMVLQSMNIRRTVQFFWDKEKDLLTYYTPLNESVFQLSVCVMLSVILRFKNFEISRRMKFEVVANRKDPNAREYSNIDQLFNGFKDPQPPQNSQSQLFNTRLNNAPFNPNFNNLHSPQLQGFRMPSFMMMEEAGRMSLRQEILQQAEGGMINNILSLRNYLYNNIDLGQETVRERLVIEPQNKKYEPFEPPQQLKYEFLEEPTSDIFEAQKPTETQPLHTFQESWYFNSKLDPNYEQTNFSVSVFLNFALKDLARRLKTQYEIKANKEERKKFGMGYSMERNRVRNQGPPIVDVQNFYELIERYIPFKQNEQKKDLQEQRGLQWKAHKQSILRAPSPVYNSVFPSQNPHFMNFERDPEDDDHLLDMEFPVDQEVMRIIQEQLQHDAQIIQPPQMLPPIQPIPQMPQIPQIPPLQDQPIVIPPQPVQYDLPPGIDMDMFNQLPQDIRQEFLLQHRRVNEPIHTQNQNQQFLAGLDPSLRQEVLLEASPEFLGTLTAEQRAQADTIRQRHARRLHQRLELTQIRELKKPAEVKIKVNPNQIQNYPEVDHMLLSKSIDSLVWPQQYSILLLCSLLQNKRGNCLVLKSVIDRIVEDKSSLIINKAIHAISQWVSNSIYDDQAIWNTSVEGLTLYQRLILSMANSKFNKNLIKLCFSLPSRKVSSLVLTGFLVGIKQMNTSILPKIQQLIELNPQLLPLIELHLKEELKKGSFIDKVRLLSYFMKLHTTLICGKMFEVHLWAVQNNYQDFGFHCKIWKIYKQKDQHARKALKEDDCPMEKQVWDSFKAVVAKGRKLIHGVLIKLSTSKDRIMSEPVSLVLKYFPEVIPFQIKSKVFRHQVAIMKASSMQSRVHLIVNRNNIFPNSYNQIMSKSIEEMRSGIHINFVNEEGNDAGGVTRQWFLLLSRQIFNPNYGLFIRSQSGNVYQPCSESHYNPEHLQYFKFIGRIVAKALYENCLVDTFFTRSLYKHILGKKLDLADLQQQDHQYSKSLRWMMENKVEPGLANFTYQIDFVGKKVSKQLVPGGTQIEVTDENKSLFVQKICQAKMFKSIQKQLQFFMQGFNEIIPHKLISIFDHKELQLMISGLPSIDINDLRNNTDYQGYSRLSPIILWFWEIVESFDQTLKAQLVQFVTGSSKVPAEGFAFLRGINGITKFSIHKDFNEGHLPKAHTCFNQLDLPEYPSKQMLNERLILALTWGNQGFGFA